MDLVSVDSTSLAFADAVELARLIRDREVSSREVTDNYLSRIEALNGPLNAVVTVVAELAQRRADAADRATAAGESWGALHGVPFTVKDALATAGIRSTGGAVEASDYVPERSAPVVTRLVSQGAIVMGKTNCPKWSLDYCTTNDVFGTTNNPWDPSRIPGGSSGGAAAAVAAGFSAFDIGTDLGGSIRLPANFCGVYGLKPSYGAVPQRGYVDRVGEAQHDIDGNHFGPIARSVRDLAFLFTLIADGTHESPEPRRDLAGYRISAWFADDAVAMDDTVVAVLEAAAARVPGIDRSQPAIGLAQMRALFGPVIAHGLAQPGRFESAERSAAEAAWQAWFAEHDIMLWPVTPTTAPLHDSRPTTERRFLVNGREEPSVSTVAWTAPINMLGYPSVVIPVGFAAGLPVGMQVIANHGCDYIALDVAARIDAIVNGYARPPAFA